MKNKQDKIALDSLIARQIVKEIMDFGITQDQIFVQALYFDLLFS